MEMYLDDVDWVSMPNTLGRSQHADGGIVGTKPYAASGAYIDRMSDHCRGCRFDPRQAVGARVRYQFDRPWAPGEARRGRLVVIAEHRDVDVAALRDALTRAAPAVGQSA